MLYILYAIGIRVFLGMTNNFSAVGSLVDMRELFGFSRCFNFNVDIISFLHKTSFFLPLVIKLFYNAIAAVCLGCIRMVDKLFNQKMKHGYVKKHAIVTLLESAIGSPIAEAVQPIAYQQKVHFLS